MILQGKKVKLRPMTVEEIPIFYKWATQSDATPFWYGDLRSNEVPTYEQFVEDWRIYYFDGSELEKGRCFAILVDDEAIGQINYNAINREDNSVELDIIIAQDTNKSKGYGSEALQTLSNYLFQEMNVQKCWIEAISDNPRAIAAYEKAGFKITRTFVDNGIECKHMELTSTVQK